MSSQKKSNHLELVYFDVCGPIEVEYLGANRYFVSSTDDASRKMWGICWREKTQVFQPYQQFQAMVN